MHVNTLPCNSQGQYVSQCCHNFKSRWSFPLAAYTCKCDEVCGQNSDATIHVKGTKQYITECIVCNAAQDDFNVRVRG